MWVYVHKDWYDCFYCIVFGHFAQQETAYCGYGAYIVIFLGGIFVIVRKPIIKNVYQLVFYPLRFLASILIFVIAEALEFELEDCKELITWTGILTVGLAVAPLISKAGKGSSHSAPELWDGKAAERIANIIAKA